MPRHAGVLSALGMLVADVTRDYSASVLQPGDALSAADLRARLRPLCDRALAELGREGFVRRRIVIEQQIDVRYIGQSYEITMPFTAGYRTEFDRRHRPAVRLLEPGPRGRSRRRARARRGPHRQAARCRSCGRAAAACRSRSATQPGRFDGRTVRVAHFRWPDLVPGDAARGPAVITGAEATAVIPPGFRFHIDGFGNVIASGRTSKFALRSSKFSK